MKNTIETIAVTGEFQGHQGDVQFYSISKLPESAKQVAKAYMADSEKSGHAHAIGGDYIQYVAEVKFEHLINTAKRDNGVRNVTIIKVGKSGAVMNHTHKRNLTEEYWDKNEVKPIADHRHTTFKEGDLLAVGIHRRVNPLTAFYEKVVD